MQVKPPLDAGDYIQNFNLPSSTGQNVSPNTLAGRPLVIFFYLKDGSESCTREVCGFRDLHDEFASLGVGILGIGAESEASHKAFADAHRLPYPLLSDSSGETCAKFGVFRMQNVDGKPALALSRTTYLFGADFRIATAYLDVDAVDHAAQVLADARALLLRDPPRDVVHHAPVLLIPNVLPADLRQPLIQLWETQNEDSGFMKQIDGKTVGLTDYSHKIRRDHYIAPGEVQARVQGYMADRVAPEIRKAFNYNVTRREDLRIACYNATTGGYFRPHRDNTTDGTAHRRFAMSLLLNDDYEGGYLRFPEYGQHRYRPDAGGAVVFSCSLLHEATDVTAGRRFVLLSFFYGEAEAKAREEYNLRTGGTYRR